MSVIFIIQNQKYHTHHNGFHSTFYCFYTHHEIQIHFSWISVNSLSRQHENLKQTLILVIYIVRQSKKISPRFTVTWLDKTLDAYTVVSKIAKYQESWHGPCIPHRLLQLSPSVNEIIKLYLSFQYWLFCLSLGYK